MLVYTKFCCCFLLTALFCADINCTALFDSKIVNGSTAFSGEFPFMVSLRRASSGRHSCGASLLNRVWVLTAAHCVVKAKPSQINVQYGSIELDKNSTELANVSNIYVHKGYEPANQYIHDIALLRLEKPVNVEEDFVGIRLPELNAITDNKTPVTLIGWGLNAVSLSRKETKTHFCAGTILNPKWILTAAHCFTFIKTPDEFIVQYNSTYLESNQSQFSSALRVIKHEGYNPTITIHDLALVELKDSIDVQVIQLPYKIKSYENVTATLLGWGLNATNGVLVKHLQKASLQSLELDKCRSQLKSLIHNSNLCAGGNQIGQCSGDSGGPLIYDNEQIGIVSWSLKPCASKPGVFTNVSYYLKWIKKVIKEL